MEHADTTAADSKASIRQGNRKKAPASKYDMIKVRVWLGDHHYVLSRYLISRMLTVTRIPHSKATKIALEVKKKLVDEGKQDVQQSEMEAVLFHEMESRGFGESYVACYRLVSRFMAARQPLVLLLCGAPWTGKSCIAQQLAGRLNLSNVLSTAFVYDMLLAGGGDKLHPVPLCSRPDLSSDEMLLNEYQRECNVVQAALEGELNKAISEGKPLIVEGSHLDPGGLLGALEARGVILLPAAGERLSTGGSSQDTGCLSLTPQMSPASGLRCDITPASLNTDATAGDGTSSLGEAMTTTSQLPPRPASTCTMRHVSHAAATHMQALTPRQTPLRPAEQPVRRSGSLPHLLVQASAPLPVTHPTRQLMLLSDSASAPPRPPQLPAAAVQQARSTAYGMHEGDSVSTAVPISSMHTRSPVGDVASDQQQPQHNQAEHDQQAVSTCTHLQQTQQQQQQLQQVEEAEGDVSPVARKPSADHGVLHTHMHKQQGNVADIVLPQPVSSALQEPQEPHTSVPSSMSDDACNSLPALILPVVLQVVSGVDHALIAADRGITSDQPAAAVSSAAAAGTAAAANGMLPAAASKLKSMPASIPVARSLTGNQPCSSLEKQEQHDASNLNTRQDQLGMSNAGHSVELLSSSQQQTADAAESVGSASLKPAAGAGAPSSGEHIAIAAAASTPSAVPQLSLPALQLPEAHHTTAAVEGKGRSGGGGPKEGADAAGGAVSGVEQLARARILQDYLRSYELQGVPVVPVRYGAFKDTVDELHEYVLAAITTAMTWMERSGSC